MKTRAIRESLVLALAVGSGVLRAADAGENWVRYCADCHGTEGDGKTRLGRREQVKNLTDSSYQTQFSDAEAARQIKEGLKTSGGYRMKAFGNRLSDTEITALIEYVRSLQK